MKSTCNLCNSISNSNKKEYEEFLSKYKNCSLKTNLLEECKPDGKNNYEKEAEAEEEEAVCKSCLQHEEEIARKEVACTCLSPHPRIVATQNDLMSTLSKLVSCIGCKTSVEKFYKQLVVANNSGASSALDPFIILSNGDLTMKRSVLMDPLSVYKLFYLNW